MAGTKGMNYPKTRKCKHGATKHGGQATPEYTAWAHIVQRCTNSKSPNYSDYGGRGITIESRWLDFREFLQDIGLRPSPLHTIERKDNDKGYFPDNCRWATQSEQQRNKRSNRRITWNGRTQVVTDWAHELGVKAHSLNERFRRGWSLERAMNTPF